MFGTLGCMVIDSDALAHEVIQQPDIKAKIKDWLGAEVFEPSGMVNRRAVARRVFERHEDAMRLEALVHPQVRVKRSELMGRGFDDDLIRAIVWDSPLLFETNAHKECDALVFVKVPLDVRLKRLARSRGWGADELARREKLQFSLDKKAQLADYCIDNSGDEASTLRQVQRTLSQILGLPV
jgi:dephospho-CoA kinase